MKNRGMGKTAKACLAVGLLLLTFGITVSSLAFSGTLEQWGWFSSSADEETADRLEGAEQPLTTLPSDDESAAAVARPDTMLGGCLVPGVDYCIGEKVTYEQATAQVDDMLEQMKLYRMNTVILSTWKDHAPIYAKASYGTPVFSQQDLFAYVVSKARENGMMVYATIPLLKGIDQPLNLYEEASVQQALKKVSDVCSYEVDGVFFEQYDASVGSGYDRYLQDGSGMGYETYQMESVSRLIRRAAYCVRKMRGTLYTGVIADSEQGFDAVGIAAGVSGEAAMATAHNDLVVQWAKSGWIHCVLAKDFRSTSDNTLSFQTVAQWWSSQLEKAECDLYIGHSATAALEGKVGFERSDQLRMQMIQLKNISQRGSAFYTVCGLKNNQSGSTEALLQYLSDGTSVDESLALKELTLTSPSKTTFTTYDSSFRLTGASDPTFPMKLDGKDLERTQEGYFSTQLDLKLGKNTFVLEHKGKTVTLKVTYKRTIIREVSPSGTQSLAGGTQFGVSAVCLRGSTVWATFRGHTITLSPSSANRKNEGGEQGGNYDVYTGSFELPLETESEQTVGPIRFTATNRGQTEKKTGAKFRIPAVTVEVPTESGTSDFSSSAVLDTAGAVSSGNRTIAQVLVDQAETFNGNMVDDFSRPINAYLPKGTLDYAAQREVVLYSGSSTLRYRKLNYGKRVYVSTNQSGRVIRTLTGTLPSTNSITVQQVSITDRYTTLTLNTQWKAPFDFTLAPQSYADPSATNPRPDYAISGFTAQYVDIAFAYAVSGQGTMNFSNSPIFSKGEWIRSKNTSTGLQQCILRLHLRKTGGLYGWSANYNDQGQLVFRFLHPAKISQSGNPYGYSLSGTKIMIDPGHGGTDPGALGSNANYSEAVLNRRLSEKVKRELESTGAQVKLTFSSGTYTLNQRLQALRKDQPDLFISIHRNANTSSSVKGYENYYFTPFSQRLAQAIHNKTASNFSEKRGSRFYPYYVIRATDCPAILTENGFVTNPTEFSTLIQDSFDEKLAKSIVAGVIDYFKGIQ